MTRRNPYAPYEPEFPEGMTPLEECFAELEEDLSEAEFNEDEYIAESEGRAEVLPYQCGSAFLEEECWWCF